MVEVQDFREMGEALGDACAVLRSNAVSAGLDAAVPTCPGWSVRDLVTHVGLVHRWATAHLRGEQPATDDAVRAQAAASGDLLAWFDDGMVDLLNAIANAPADLQAWFFLPDAPPPRDAWLRRQVHETTIHAIDAMAARLGRAPAASEVWVPTWLAADGIDELLTGFVARRRYAPTSRQPRTTLVRATDADRAWEVRTDPDGAQISRVASDGDADLIVAGAARPLYLALWNRGDAPDGGDAAWWTAWRERTAIRW